jgi:RHS repeat-associated core domain
LRYKSSPEFSTTYNYNSDGLLSNISSTNGTSSIYTYDSYGRIDTAEESSVDSKWLQKTYSYSNNNIASIGYASQTGTITTENYYYTNGALTEIKLNGATSIWKLNSENDLGQPTNVTTGSFDRSYGYDAYGLPTSRTAGSFQNFSYGFDVTKGNLTYRKDNSTGIQENFSYDNLTRLTGYNSYTASYDLKGNITQKTDVGNTFNYNTSEKPYAISSISTPSNAIPQRNQSITYNSFKRPDTIIEGIYDCSFVYNDDGSRVKMELKKNNISELRRYYLGGQYELDEGVAGTKEKLYLGGDYYSAAAVYVKENSGSWQIYYICRDYLGSITHITNSSGTVVQQLSYDAWGRLRNPSNQTVYDPDSEPALFLGRGYTGHEHLTMFGLVNMNARLYDPAVGRFLSADPYVQAPDFSQNFNRYSYAMNNPLKFTDPNGEFLHIIIGAIIGGTVNVIYKACTGQLHSWKDGFVAFGIGAVAGAAGAATGGIAFAAAGGAAGGMGGFLAGAAGGAASSAIMAPVQSLGNHLYFGDPMLSMKEYAMGIGMGALAGGAVNGGIAAIKGNNFWTGKDIALGRSTFSISNTPTKVAPEMSEMPGKAVSVDAVSADAPPAKQPLSNQELLQKAAEKADAAVEGNNAVAGTAKHKYATELLDRYQKINGDRGLEFKVHFGLKTDIGNNGILDVLDIKNKVIYDFKFGYPNMTETKFLLTPQMLKYQSNYPDHLIKIIHIHF